MHKLMIEADTLMPLRDVVYKTLQDAILRGELKPGTRLMEIHLASELGVSRTPVREAIRMLEREGLAITYPRKGAQVARMTEKDLTDVIEIRESLDVLAAIKACDNADEEIIKRLEESVVAFEEIIGSKDMRAIVEADEVFHNVIYEAANNRKLTEIVRSLREQMYRYRYEYIKEGSDLKGLLKEHKEILSCIKGKDKQNVAVAMQKHLAGQYDAVLAMIKNLRTNS